MAFLYYDIISHSHIILSGQIHIADWYCNNLDRQLCTTWVTLTSDSKNVCGLLQLDSTVSSSPHKCFLNISMAHLTAADSPANYVLTFSSGNTVNIDMKEIGDRCIPSR